MIKANETKTISSGIDWFGEIPSDWAVRKIKNYFFISKEKNDGQQGNILSLTQRGIKIRDISNNEGQLAESYDNYTKVNKGDIVMNPMDLITGFVDLSEYEGVVSLAYKVLRKLPYTEIDLRYFTYFLQWHYYDKIFFPFGMGVSPDHRWTLKNDDILNFPILIPPIDIQKRIVDFLDGKIAVIDKTIETIGYEGSLLKRSGDDSSLIQLLKEYKTSLLYHTLTGKI